MKPKRIILVRHGESYENIDKSVYRSKPDYAIKLTKDGIDQALNAGKNINDIIGIEDYCIYYSPYFRTRQTMDFSVKNLKGEFCQFKREEPRIREQEYSGGIRDYDRIDFEKERESFGKFFYRMNGGESAADVFDRVSDFIGTLHRDFEKENYPKNTLIFTHGMSMRVFIMRFLHNTVEQFELWKNPKNGEIYILELQDNNKYKLVIEIPENKMGYGWKYNE